MKDLVWNVFIENSNRDRIEVFNIFDHAGFASGVEKAYKSAKGNFEAFSKQVENELRYYFWSKCEWEIILTAWPPYKDFNDQKVDVFEQILLNKDVFMRHIWDCLNK